MFMSTTVVQDILSSSSQPKRFMAAIIQFIWNETVSGRGFNLIYIFPLLESRLVNSSLFGRVFCFLYRFFIWFLNVPKSNSVGCCKVQVLAPTLGLKKQNKIMLLNVNLFLSCKLWTIIVQYIKNTENK